MDTRRAARWIDDFWEAEIIPSISTYIGIPNKSPDFDPAWEKNGYMEEAVAHMLGWATARALPGMTLDVHRLPGLTPTILIQLPGTAPGNVLLYGHLDKQPEFEGWEDGLAPWTPVRRGDRLFGRGGADDGYAIYAALAAILHLAEVDAALPSLSILIEASEESGSPDLPAYMEALGTRIGDPDLVIALDSSAGNYDQLWMTTSLRGMVLGTLTVQVLDEGVHSGMAGGIVPSSFRILRQLLSRLEDEATGNLIVPSLTITIPASREHEAAYAGEVLGDGFSHMYPFAGHTRPMAESATDLVLNNSWRGSLEITGADGLPAVADAGNVLRPATAVKVSLRIPPTIDAAAAQRTVNDLLTRDPPEGAAVSFDSPQGANGWHAPVTKPWLDVALTDASTAFFGKPAVSMGCGGSIPFMGFLADRYPSAQFVITGVLGPHSNAHGPNEFLDLPTAKRVTGCVAWLLQTVAEKS
jgi:acetylornithine deacetylase/succinyl-diaminopimelate desuccinylase-like protein